MSFLFNQNLIPSPSWIIHDDNPLLRKKCQNLTFPLSSIDQEKISQMISYIDSCYNGTDKIHHLPFPGIAIAANQVGYLKKVIYLHFNLKDKHYRYLLANPKYTIINNEQCFIKNGEGCLSVLREIKGDVVRYNNIHLQAIDLFNQQEIEFDASGILAICLQHEIDHLEGILFYDHINQKKPFIKNKEKYIIY